MTNVFSEADFHLRRCRKNEIGMPWEDRWSIEDCVDNLCTEQQVGISKFLPAPEEIPEITEDLKAIAIDRGIDPTDVDAMIALMFDLDPAGFSKRNPQLVVGLRDQQRLAKQQKAAGSIALAEMTAKRLERASTVEIVSKLIMPVFNESEEVQQRILSAWGITMDDMQDLVDTVSA